MYPDMFVTSYRSTTNSEENSLNFHHNKNVKSLFLVPFCFYLQIYTRYPKYCLPVKFRTSLSFVFLVSVRGCYMLSWLIQTQSVYRRSTKTQHINDLNVISGDIIYIQTIAFTCSQLLLYVSFRVSAWHCKAYHLLMRSSSNLGFP
jgi:hypothetical protein